MDRKRLLFKTSSSAIGLLTAFLIIESAVRLLNPQYRYPHPQGLYVPDPDTGYRNTAHFSAQWRTDVSDVSIQLNSLGMRGREPRAVKKGPRILILGDSFTFGPEVEDEKTFSALCGGMLRTGCPDVEWEVLNGGVNGFGTIHQARLLEHIGPALQPDIVVVAFYNNDIKDSIREPRTVWNGLLVDGKAPVYPDLRRWYSHSWALAERRTQGLIDKYVKPASVLAVYRRDYTEQMQAAWQMTERSFRDIFAWCRTNGVRPAVMIISNGRQLMPEQFHDFRIADAEYDFLKPNRLVAEVCTRECVPVLDLLESFRNAGAPEALYFHGAGHFTPLGHETAARALADFLFEQYHSTR